MRTFENKTRNSAVQISNWRIFCTTAVEHFARCSYYARDDPLRELSRALVDRLCPDPYAHENTDDATAMCLAASLLMRRCDSENDAPRVWRETFSRETRDRIENAICHGASKDNAAIDEEKQPYGGEVLPIGTAVVCCAPKNHTTATSGTDTHDRTNYE